MTFIKYLNQSLHSPSLLKNTGLGAGIGLILISAFLLKADNPNPEWHRFWMIRPLVIVPFAGAMGGFFYTMMEPVRRKGGWIKTAAILVCLLVYIIGLFMGTVLGLDGTYWD